MCRIVLFIRIERAHPNFEVEFKLKKNKFYTSVVQIRWNSFNALKNYRYIKYIKHICLHVDLGVCEYNTGAICERFGGKEVCVIFGQLCDALSEFSQKLVI